MRSFRSPLHATPRAGDPLPERCCVRPSGVAAAPTGEGMLGARQDDRRPRASYLFSRGAEAELARPPALRAVPGLGQRLPRTLGRGSRAVVTSLVRAPAPTVGAAATPAGRPRGVTVKAARGCAVSQLAPLAPPSTASAGGRAGPPDEPTVSAGAPRYDVVRSRDGVTCARTALSEPGHRAARNGRASSPFAPLDRPYAARVPRMYPCAEHSFAGRRAGGPARPPPGTPPPVTRCRNLVGALCAAAEALNPARRGADPVARRRGGSGPSPAPGSRR